MYEVDFLPVEAGSGPSGKSGDAITMQFTRAFDGSQRVIVIDAGFGSFGQKVVDHVRDYYNTEHVDLVISTHPDADHLNGLRTVIEQLDVDELLLHQPRLHAVSAADFTNIEAVDALIKDGGGEKHDGHRAIHVALALRGPGSHPRTVALVVREQARRAP